MRPSSLTLTSLVASFPKRVTSGADIATFGVAQANAVFSEIEKLCDPDVLVAESAILLQDGVTDYAAPSTAIRKIRGIYGVNQGEVAPNRERPVPFQELGTRIRLPNSISLSGNDDIQRTVSAGAPSDLNLVFDNTAGYLDAQTDNSLIGRLCIVTHATAVAEYRIICANDQAGTLVTLNGNLNAVAAVGDAYKITSNFLIIEYSRYITRLTAASQTLDIPIDLEDCFAAGLKFRYYLNQDEADEQAKKWEGIYNAKKKEIKSDFSTQAMGAFVNRPAPLPRFQ